MAAALTFAFLLLTATATFAVAIQQVRQPTTLALLGVIVIGALSVAWLLQTRRRERALRSRIRGS